METQPRFTVVLLGYQSAEYISKALDSIAGQTFRDFDVMCVVEECTDGSLALCRDWAARNPNVDVVSLPKSGSGSCSRNYAINHAKGKYLVFLDGDDWIVDDTLERLDSRLAETGDVDVLAFAMATSNGGHVDIDATPAVTNFTPEDSIGTFSGQEAIRRAGRNCGRFHGYTWLNIYRTQFLRGNSLLQKLGVILEDVEWVNRVWYRAERFAYLHAKLYVYRRNDKSIMSEATSRIVFDLMDNFASMARFAEDNSVPHDIVAIWSNQWISMLYWFMFEPVSSRKVSDADRRKALATLIRDIGRKRFKELIALTSRPKRIAAAFIFLSELGWQLPAKLFFRKLYYPLIARRQRR